MHGPAKKWTDRALANARLQKVLLKSPSEGGPCSLPRAVKRIYATERWLDENVPFDVEPFKS
jgi:hypothetical protein